MRVDCTIMRACPEPKLSGLIGSRARPSADDLGKMLKKFRHR